MSLSPRSGETHLWFGYWMGCADRHRLAASVCRDVAKLVPDRAEEMLAQAYTHDKLLDQCLQLATAWAARAPGRKLDKPEWMYGGVS